MEPPEQADKSALVKAAVFLLRARIRRGRRIVGPEDGADEDGPWKIISRTVGRLTFAQSFVEAADIPEEEVRCLPDLILVLVVKGLLLQQRCILEECQEVVVHQGPSSVDVLLARSEDAGHQYPHFGGRFIVSGGLVRLLSPAAKSDLHLGVEDLHALVDSSLQGPSGTPAIAGNCELGWKVAIVDVDLDGRVTGC